MAKKVSCTPRFTASYINFSLESPFSARLPMEKGKAAPIANRKKGKTRSTHVMPGKEGLNIWSGGGVCA